MFLKVFFAIFILFGVFKQGFSYGRKISECATPEVTKRWGPYLQQISKPFEHGEEPFWDERVQKLYFVDLHQGLINSFDPETKEINSVHLDGDVSPVIPTNTLNKFAVGNNNSVVTIFWDGKNNSEAKDFEILSTVDKDKPGNRFNDGKADKYGRLWWGTIGYENASGVIPDQASLYKFTQDDLSDPDVEIRPVTNSNGLAWNKDNTKFFYIDTPTRKIAQYDFNLEKGEISNKTIIFDLNDYAFGTNKLPDGMTIDEDDNLFIALYNGGSIIKVDTKTGKVLQKIAIPAARVTSCMFGGRNLDILFVTTSRFGLSEAEQSTQPAAGALFAITGLGVRGRPMYYADF